MSDATPPTIYFVVTIDVEADNVWADPTNLSVENLGAIPKFQELCNRYGVIPTYLLNYETLSDQAFVSFLKSTKIKGECEIGMHPHVWTIPPFIDEKNGIDIAIVRYYQSMLDKNVLFAKLDALHQRIINKIGITPNSHRAGRWGVCVRTIRWLNNNGYVVDTSVVPQKSFKDPTIDPLIYPDYYRASQYPYRLSDGGILKIKGNLDIVEVPITNVSKNVYTTIVKIADQLKTMRGGTMFKNLLHNLSMYPLELRPYPNYQRGTLPRIAGIAINKNLPIINFMFHSSELMLGGSPYSADERSAREVWNHIEELFSFVSNINNIKLLGLSEAVINLKKTRYFE